MADDSSINNINSPQLQSAIDELNKPSEVSGKDTSKGTGPLSGDVVSQQEFLMLLVNQLQNQDPLDPMNSEEFAVQLAQFSQVEQLVSINQKLDNSNSAQGSMTSMASFLGHEVVLNDSLAPVQGGKGPNIMVNLPADVQSARLDFVNDQGGVVHSMEIKEAKAGNNVVELAGLTVADGDYAVRGVAVGSQGEFVDFDTKITGTVEGFVLEPEPKLIVDGTEVSMADVTEVYRGK